MSDLSSTIDLQMLRECAQALVRAAGENPPGDEEAVAQECASYARQAGCEVELIRTGDRRVNVIATLTSARPGKTLIWNGHIDVVPAGDPALWSRDPYAGDIEDGVLHGRGSADMKSGCAAAIAAAAALHANGGPRAGKLVLQLVADEEVLGPHGTLALYERGLIEGDAAIVGEPTELEIAIAERGMVWVRVQTHGIAAHGSRPELGHSAIEDMSKAVLALRAMTWDDPHPLLGPPTLNIGVIEGGDKINIVPPWCTIVIDRRTIPSETHDSILAEMRATLAGVGVEADLEIIHSAQPCEVSVDEPIVLLAASAIERVTGAAARTGVMTGATDAHVLMGMAKIPTIILGPGSLSVAHAANESAPMDQIEAAARIYAQIFDEFLQ